MPISEADLQASIQRMTGLPTEVPAYGSQTELPPEVMAAMGLARAEQYMAANGPTRPIHFSEKKVITKAQLEEQKMNEAAGYPSNLEEASRVKALEKQLGEMHEMLARLSGGTQPSPPAPVQLQQRPDVQSIPSFQVAEPPQPTSSNASFPSKRVVTLSNGKTVEVAAKTPPMTQLIEPPGIVDGEDLWTPDPEPIVPVVDPKADRLATLVTEVTVWLQRKDPLIFWRNSLKKIVSRHVSYESWPENLRQRFIERFRQTVLDPIFVRATCEKVLACEFGYALSPEKVASQVVLCAGFVAYALIEI